MGRHERNESFSGIDEVESSGILSDVVRKNEVFLGGSSVGKGLTKAARYFLNERLAKAPVPEHFEFAGASELNDDALLTPLEDSFYVLDIGVLVSQVYQWRQAFPRVEAFYAVKVCHHIMFLCIVCCEVPNTARSLPSHALMTKSHMLMLISFIFSATPTL
jgi:hypothetical protein